MSGIQVRSMIGTVSLVAHDALPHVWLSVPNQNRPDEFTYRSVAAGQCHQCGWWNTLPAYTSLDDGDAGPRVPCGYTCREPGCGHEWINVDRARITWVGVRKPREWIGP